MTPAEFEFKFTIAYNMFKEKHGEPVYVTVSTSNKDALLSDGIFYKDSNQYTRYKDLVVSWNVSLKNSIELSGSMGRPRIKF